MTEFLLRRRLRPTSALGNEITLGLAFALATSLIERQMCWVGDYTALRIDGKSYIGLSVK
jgi:hypothetical protein